MIRRSLAVLVLVFATSPLAAQCFVPDQSFARRMTRVTWLGETGEQSITIEYSQPPWAPAYDTFMAGKSAQHARLGRDAWTTLQTSVGVAFGERKLPRGRWYLGAHRDEKQNWTLTLMAADKIDLAGLGAGATFGIKPDLQVPMHLDTLEESTELLDIKLSANKTGKENVSLAITWGRYRLRGDLIADFDTRKPKGAPEFALSAADKLITTESGLQYEQLRAGVGEFPRPADKVSVHYSGWLTDGTPFDSSYRRGNPTTFPVNALVKGFSEGLQLMQPGAIFRLTIKPELAYGAKGAGDVVPPNSTLVFTVTLLSIEK